MDNLCHGAVFSGWAVWNSVTGSGCHHVDPRNGLLDRILPNQDILSAQLGIWKTGRIPGETVTLTCILNGGGVRRWQYSWYKDDLDIQQNKLQDYTIRSVSESDAGKYTCRGTEISGSRYSHISNAVTLTVSVLSKVTVTVQNSSVRIVNKKRQLTGTVEVKIMSGRPRKILERTARRIARKSRSKPKLTSDSEGSVLTGNTVTLKCHIDHQSTGWKFYWYYNTQNTEKTTTETNSYTVHSVKVSDGGQYWCRAGRGKPDYYTDYSDGLWIHVKESPKPVVSVYPDTHLFRGENVTLRCHINGTGDTEWAYSWTVKKTNNRNMITQCNTQECKVNNIQQTDSGKYTCRGKIREQNTEMSDAVTLTVSSDKPKPVLSVSPDRWLTPGESVTLLCRLRNSSTGWTFSWFTVQINSTDKYDYQLVSDSIRGSKGIYTVSSVTVKHRGVYACRAERGDPVYHTKYSNTKPLFVTDVSRLVSLIIRPNRSQHFSSESLSLSCEEHSKFTGWTVRRYTDKLGTCSSSIFGSETESTCTISYLHTSDTGVYWCQSESGEKLHPVNISVHDADVILDSPVHPVTEGDLLTLHCLYRDKNYSYLRAEFYKDGSVLQNQTTGDMMIIPTVSKSHEGFYYCKHPERGESPKSWISVRDKPQTVLSVSQKWLTEGDSVTLMCEVTNSSTGWTFSWFTEHESTGQICFTSTSTRLYTHKTSKKWAPYLLLMMHCIMGNCCSEEVELVPDSIRGSKGIYTVRSVTVKHTGVYVCRAERGDPAYHTEYSNTKPLFVTSVSPSVSLIIKPNRSQHFSSESLSLSCEDHSNSTGWTVRRYTDKLKLCSSSDTRSTGATSTCTIRSLNTSDTGVYWCQSKSIGTLHHVNISVHNGNVILDSPVHPVTEGDSLTLRCLYRDKKPSNLRAEFYKDGSVVQNQTTGDMMTIPTVSKSHEGFYYCKHPERGESPKSWISVRRGSQVKTSSFTTITFPLAVCPYLIATVVLVFKCCRSKVSHSSVKDQLQYAVREDEASN
ncbi:Fc receptor-like protein 5 [Misgurnus anguillicaudatus]|uniref:Fc receptor-like protein 5 n=1 Tax=Misgurnus anguillicaudatus TaxID=75329 RepID=UPI003CCF590C